MLVVTQLAAGVEKPATEADVMPVERSAGVATKKQRFRDRVLYISDMSVSNRGLAQSFGPIL